MRIRLRLLPLIALVLMLSGIAPAQASILDRLLGWFSSSIQTKGLSIHLNGNLSADQIDLRDQAGIYATLQQVVVQWSPFALLHGEIRVSLLTVQKAEVDRLPESSSSSGGSSLPSKIDIQKLEISKLTLAPPVAGTEITLAVQASGQRSGPDQQSGTLTATMIGTQGSIKLDGSATPAGLKADLALQEAAGGPVARAIGMPGIGPIDITANLHGPRDKLATALAVTAGPLSAKADGSLDLTNEAADLTLIANAPAMQPRPDLSWQSVAIDAHLQGKFSAPQVTGQARIETLSAGEVKVRQIALNASGDKGHVALTGELDGLIVPGKQPDMFASAPVLLTADARLSAPDRPVTFSLRHPLIEANGTARTAGAEALNLELRIPALGPFAAAAGEDLQGKLTATLAATRQQQVTTADLQATIGVTGGKAPIPAVIGPDARLVLAGSIEGEQAKVSRFSFDGQDLHLAAQGDISPQAVALDWDTALARLEPLDPRLGGNIQAHGHVGGSSNDLNLTADLSGAVSLQGQSSGPFTAHLTAQGLPHMPNGRLTAQGELLSSPIDVALSGGEQPDGALALTIEQAEWKSLSAQGRLTLPPGQTIPIGQVELAVGKLGDFSPLLGRTLTGSVRASLDATQAQAAITASVLNAGLPGAASLKQAALQTTITDLSTHPVVDGKLTIDGLTAGKISGSAQIAAQGPETALAVQASARSPSLDGAPATLATSGTVNIPDKVLALSSLTGSWKGQDLRLLQPVQFGFANGVDIHELRLAINQALIAVNGQIGTTLNLTATARNVPLSLASLVSPNLKASGTLSAQAQLAGTPSAPTGTIHADASGVQLDTQAGRSLPPATLTAAATLEGKTAQIDARAAAGSSFVTLQGRAPFSTTAPMDLQARGRIDLALANGVLASPGASQGGGVAGTVTLAANLTGTPASPNGTVRADATGVRMLTQSGQALPPATVHATATLAGSTVQLDTRVSAGSSFITVAGRAPLQTTGPLDLRADGTMNLSLLNPLLEASGQHVTGVITIASRVGGTISAPRIDGSARLSGGDFQDYAQGVHLSHVAAVITAAGPELRVASLTAQAGNGTLTGSGTIGIMAAGMPVDLHLVARNATPLAGGEVTATLNADLTITGQAEGQLTLGGAIFVIQAVVRVPNKLPTSVATIPVRIAGAPPAPPPKPAISPVIAMNLTIRAPQQVFIRGRGLNAELGGTVTIQGTTKAMQPRGILRLRRGTFNLVGNTLTFDSGDIDFNGGSLTDPAIRLVATSTVNGTVATLTVSGTARDPKISLTSQPELPQDQILALLLFHTNTGQLSAFQIASIAAGLAEISGTTSNFPNPLEGLQNALGLDQLGIGSGPNGAPTLQAGRYIGRRLYVGAQESTGGSGAQGVVTYDLTHGLKLNATVGTGQTTSAIGATGESNGASVGITYQFQY